VVLPVVDANRTAAYFGTRRHRSSRSDRRRRSERSKRSSLSCRLAEAIQDATGETVTLAYVDQGYTGDKPAEAARQQGIALEVVKLPEAKRGFVLLPRRWVVERSFAWATRCRRLAKDSERYASTLAGLHIVAFACFMLKQALYSPYVHNTL